MNYRTPEEIFKEAIEAGPEVHTIYVHPEEWTSLMHYSYYMSRYSIYQNSYYDLKDGQIKMPDILYIYNNWGAVEIKPIRDFKWEFEDAAGFF